MGEVYLSVELVFDRGRSDHTHNLNARLERRLYGRSAAVRDIFY